MEKPKIFERFFVAVFIAGLFLYGFSIYSKTPESSYPFEIHYLDVGQGDATLIKLKENIEILIDGGPDSKINYKVGELLSPSNDEIEVVIISHLHSDHIAGINYLIKNYKIKKIYFSNSEYESPEIKELVENIKLYKIDVEKIAKGEKKNLYGTEIEMLWPDKNYLNPNPNEESLIFNLSYGRCRYLFAGDSSAKTQDKIIEDIKKINVLKVSHHGSKTGTAEKLIANASPDFSVISVGEKNSYHQPSKTTIDMLIGTKIFRTDIDKDIRFGCDGENNLLIP